jgi:hypothetical protein
MDDLEGLSAVWTTISLVFITEAHRNSPAPPDKDILIATFP